MMSSMFWQYLFFELFDWSIYDARYIITSPPLLCCAIAFLRPMEAWHLQAEAQFKKAKESKQQSYAVLVRGAIPVMAETWSTSLLFLVVFDQVTPLSRQCQCHGNYLSVRIY